MSIIAPLIGIIGFGLSHGINPSHGWPVALLYAIRSRKALLSGIVSSSIIAGAHFMSSIAVVVTYIIAINSLDVQLPEVYMRYGAVIALGILAYVFWKEKHEDLVETQHGHLHDSELWIFHDVCHVFYSRRLNEKSTKSHV
jgi:nickel/cobalt exporter